MMLEKHCGISQTLLCVLAAALRLDSFLLNTRIFKKPTNHFIIGKTALRRSTRVTWASGRLGVRPKCTNPRVQSGVTECHKNEQACSKIIKRKAGCSSPLILLTCLWAALRLVAGSALAAKRLIGWFSPPACSFLRRRVFVFALSAGSERIFHIN